MRKKLLALIFVLLFLSLFISNVAAITTFGYTTKGTSYGTLTNRIKGSKYYLPIKAYAQNITVYLYMNEAGGTGTARCAIYRTDLTLLAMTEELIIPQDYNNWKTFNFTSPPLLNIGYYWLVAWANTPTSGEFRVYKDANATDQQVYQIQTYTGNFPNPLGEAEYFGYYAYNMSIYCGYSTGEGGNGNGNGNGNGEADINIINVPLKLGERLGITSWSSGMLLSALFLFPVNMILMLWKKGGIGALIFNFAMLGIFTSVGWLPVWTVILIGIVVVAISGLKMKDVL